MRRDDPRLADGTRVRLDYVFSWRSVVVPPGSCGILFNPNHACDRYSMSRLNPHWPHVDTDEEWGVVLLAPNEVIADILRRVKHGEQITLPSEWREKGWLYIAPFEHMTALDPVKRKVRRGKRRKKGDKKGEWNGCFANLLDTAGSPGEVE